MKLYETKLELTAIRTICGSNKKRRAKMLATVNPEYFYSEPAVEAINRIFKLVKSEAEIPEYKELLSDPVLSETSRVVLRKHKEQCESSKELRRTIRQLQNYMQARKLHFLSERLNDELSKDKVDIKELVHNTTESVGNLRTRDSTVQEFFHFGKSNSSAGILQKMLSDEKPELVPTGFKDFDERNGGIAWGSLVVLAGPAGGGKTALAIQMAMNMSKIGRENVVYIPLEMDENEMAERMMANLSGIGIDKIKQKKLKTKERNRLVKAYKKFYKDLKSDNTRFSIFSPYEGITMTEALWAVKPYPFRVVVLDYLGLLEGTGGEQQWQAMGEATRQAKIWAKKNNAIVVVLAQSDDKEHMLRYSKVAKDHANNLWSWLVTDETRENRVMNIKQGKARNQTMFDFTLSFDPDLYRVFDYTESDNTDNSDVKDGSYLEDMSND